MVGCRLPKIRREKRKAVVELECIKCIQKMRKEKTVDTLRHRFKSVRCYEGEYFDPETKDRFMTVLCDWSCTCGKQITGRPEGLGAPFILEECPKRRPS